jgi:signal transduction histidine kinase
MRLRETVRRLVRRADVRAAGSISSLLILAIALQCFVLYAFVATDSLDEADRWLQHSLDVVEGSVAQGVPTAEAIEDARDSLPELVPAVRWWDASSRLVADLGAWPPAERTVPSSPRGARRPLRDFRLMDSDRHVVGSVELATGERVELALPLLHFASETGEVGGGLLLIGILSGLTALVVGARATSRSFAPVRQATALLHGVNAQRLGSRLGTRGSGDPVDRHAETLNQVLAGIDASFARVRAFGSDVAHELRTPVNRIRNLSEVALMADDQREQARALETIRESTEEISRIIDSLLLLAEIDGQGFELDRQTLDLDERILRTADVYAPLFEERGIRLAASSQAGTVHGDGTLVDRVLVNLLDNALRYADAKGTVEISALRSDGGVVVRVDDSGPGIAPEDRDRVFDRFSRLDQARKGEGSGLGLALARAIARVHGGDLVVGDSPLGGARFVWEIPHARASGPQRGARQATPRHSSASRLVGAQAAATGGSRAP